MSVDGRAADLLGRRSVGNDLGSLHERHTLVHLCDGGSGKAGETWVRRDRAAARVKVEVRRARLGRRARDGLLGHVGVGVGVRQRKDHSVPHDEHGGDQKSRQRDTASHT